MKKGGGGELEREDWKCRKWVSFCFLDRRSPLNRGGIVCGGLWRREYNCGNVNSFFVRLPLCLVFVSTDRNGITLYPNAWFYRDLSPWHANITVADIQHIIFHCCDLIYIFELLYVDADIKQNNKSFTDTTYNRCTIFRMICRIADRHPWMINYTLKFQCVQRFSTLP